MRRRLRPHQVKALQHLLHHKHAGLFYEMRLGKSLATIRRVELGRPSKVLVVAPPSAMDGWCDELAAEGLPVAKLVGSRTQRLKLLDSQAAIWHLINSQGHIALPEIGERAWDVVVVDESTFIKNPQAKVTKFFLNGFARTDHRYLLTGLPNPESDLDLVCQMIFMRGQCCGYSSYWNFRARMMEPGRMHWEWQFKPGAREALWEQVDTYCLRLSRKEAGWDIPKVYQRRGIDLPGPVARTYNTLERDMILETASGTYNMHWAAEQWVALHRLASGLGPNGELLHRGKVDVVCTLANGELASQQVVVWGTYLDAIHHTALALRRCGHTVETITGADHPQERTRKRVAFQDGHIQWLVVQSQVGETGMNLSAANTAIYLQQPPGRSARLQTEDRIISLDKPGPMLYIMLLAHGTVDEDLYVAHQVKGWVNTRGMVDRIRQRRQGRGES